jgi:hypothetical protein
MAFSTFFEFLSGLSESVSAATPRQIRLLQPDNHYDYAKSPHDLTSVGMARLDYSIMKLT